MPSFYRLYHRERFISTSVSSTDKMHEVKVFKRSGPYLMGGAGTLFPPTIVVTNGVLVPIVTFGGPTHLLLPWLMKAYPDNTAPAGEGSVKCSAIVG